MSFKDPAQLTRSCVYLIVFAIVLAIAWWGTPSRDFTPHGILLPTAKTTYAAVDPQTVSVSQGLGVNGTVIGTVNIEAYAPAATRDVEMAAVQYATKLAAQAGADQLIVTQFLTDPQSKTLILYAQASRN
ncbi:MAG: hypothetical protein EXR81_06265 [Gammaproteobacteria bacterium]|nr:hypothetical protein [Gammaproteobacteria bacterium]